MEEKGYLNCIEKFIKIVYGKNHQLIESDISTLSTKMKNKLTANKNSEGCC